VAALPVLSSKGVLLSSHLQVMTAKVSKYINSNTNYLLIKCMRRLLASTYQAQAESAEAELTVSCTVKGGNGRSSTLVVEFVVKHALVHKGVWYKKLKPVGQLPLGCPKRPVGICCMCTGNCHKPTLANFPAAAFRG
jgi:hypothetical protein